MELHKFIRTALLDIASAVNDAREEAPIAIAPGRVEGELQVEPREIKFELTVSNSHDGEGRINVVSIFDAGASIESKSTNKIEFSVPVYFQAPNTEK